MASFTVSLLYTILLIKSTLKCAVTMWIQSNVTIPRIIDESAVGFYEDEIYIFGGSVDKRQIIRYDVTRNAFIDDGTDLLSADTRSLAQFYAQSGDVMYFSKAFDDSFSIYDFSRKQFTDNYITTPVTVNGFTCLSATDEYLFVIGGKNNGNTAQTLHLLSAEWAVSYMNTARRSSSCTIDRDRTTLYAIAGQDQVYIDSIEMLNITDIGAQSWVLLDETLTDHGLQGTRALLHQKSNRIFVIGGFGPNWSNSVHIINTVTNHVTLSSDLLPYNVTTTAALIVDNILYAFGGYGDAHQSPRLFDTWMFYILSNPTAFPSQTPTSFPSQTPTPFPSQTPTPFPSQTPTPFPSQTPTSFPSQTPTSFPSQTTSTFPSQTPTSFPSQTPSTFPSRSSPLTTQVVSAPSDILLVSTTSNATPITTLTHQTSRKDYSLSIALTLTAIVACLAAIVFIVYMLKKHRKAYTEFKNDAHRMTMDEMHHVVPCSDERERERMISWLRNTVGLEQYIPLFLDCGYDSMRMVQEIEGRQDLIDMGIIKVAHQILLLKAIGKIQNADFNINMTTRQHLASVYIDAADGEQDEESSVHSLYVVKHPTRNTSITTAGTADANQIRSRISNSSYVHEGVNAMGYTHEGPNDTENKAVQKEPGIGLIGSIDTAHYIQ
eukprot:354699_1